MKPISIKPLKGPLLLLLLLLITSCKQKKASEAPETQVDEIAKSTLSLPLERLNLPKGFTIDTFAEGIDDARSMAMGADGTLFVSDFGKGLVYRIDPA